MAIAEAAEIVKEEELKIQLRRFEGDVMPVAGG